jgi:hypothetical protein
MSIRVWCAALLLPLAASSARRPSADAHIEIRRTQFDGGQAASERRYVEDRAEGRHAGWWENGAQRFEFTYRDGVMEGVGREWFVDGRLYRVTHYRHGQEEGAQQMWWPDGTLRASYVVHDGRRFGLLGAKGCVTLDSADDSASKSGTAKRVQ